MNSNPTPSSSSLKEITIGRSPESGLVVPEEKSSVSKRHARIVVSPSGLWTLEDLGSTNGTFVRDETGNFTRVHSKEISETTVIRLGDSTHRGFEFMARRAFVAPDEDYAYEFHSLKKKLQQLNEEEEEAEKLNRRNMTFAKLAPAVGMAACVVAQLFIPALDRHPDITLNLNRVVMVLAPLAVGLLFRTDSGAVKAIRKKRTKTVTCPRCKRPLSDFDVEQGRCSACKAH